MAFRLKAIAELEEEEALQSVVPLPQHPQRQTWREWLLRRSPVGASSSGALIIDLRWKRHRGEGERIRGSIAPGRLLEVGSKMVSPG